MTNKYKDFKFILAASVLFKWSKLALLTISLCVKKWPYLSSEALNEKSEDNFLKQLFLETFCFLPQKEPMQIERDMANLSFYTERISIQAFSCLVAPFSDSASENQKLAKIFPALIFWPKYCQD